MDAEEQYLMGRLRMLQESYADAAQPIIDRLVRIKSAQPPAPIFMTVDQAEAAGFDVDDLQTTES